MPRRVKCRTFAAKLRRRAFPPYPRRVVMKELLLTNNVVRLSWAQAFLRDAGIDSVVLDHPPASSKAASGRSRAG
jgi:hypothetical protein